MPIWTDTQLAELRTLYADTPGDILAGIFGRTPRAISQMARKLGLKKSEALRKANCFRPGQAPANKGRSFQAGGRSAETRFQKGRLPHNHQPIGHTRLTAEGYWQRKTQDTRCTRRDYISLHHLIWRWHGREIPPGHALIFIDGNPKNLDINNLQLLSRRELMLRNSRHYNYPPEINQCMQLLGALKRKINNRSHKHE